MQHGSLRAPVRVFMAAVLLCLTFLPRQRLRRHNCRM